MDAETQEIRQARQRASVKWLLSKAFNNRVPDNLKEPFYRDHENQERLKPQIIVDLGNATLYCQTLSNLYSDPNYQSLNHWSILQTLSRKGVPVKETPEMPITETVLIQTNPLRINAHMLVIESLMLLYAKEITSGERITNAIRRISGNSNYQVPQLGQHFEQQLLAWISYTCSALKRRIASEIETVLTDENGVRLQTPDIPPVNDFQGLCDGICLALLISYYCPKVLPWSSVRINYLPAVEDSIHNILLVSNFSQKHLPYNVFHMTPEDVTYMRGSMKLNLVVLLTDLFNVFEIHPAKCVSYPGMDAPVTRSSSANVILRKSTTSSSVDYQTVETNSSFPNHTNEEAFIVHKSRGVTTLSSMHSQHQHQHQQQQQQQQMEPLVPARLRQSKEKTNTETKADERGDYPVVPAGRPSNWDHNRKPSYAGRRSRRNSSSEDSQLTIENFGGSQDQINMLGRYERDRDRERKLSNTSIEPAVAIRSSIADARGTLQIGYDTDSGSEKQDRETEKFYMKRQGSIDNVSLAAHNNILNNEPSSSSHRGHSVDKDFNDSLSDSKAPVYEPEIKLVRKSSTASMPVTSSWQQDIDPYDDDVKSLESASKLTTIRMKLEEKRRRIEQDKRRYEMALLRQQERDDLESEMGKWETLSNESKRTPDMDPLEMDKYQQSIAIMNMNLQDIQHDIQRLTTQQNQIQAQHLQAQQLLQAQQIANMLNQQTYGSQQHLAADPYNNQRQQSSFGSSPHIPQAFQNQVNAYNSRPPSRDPYHQIQHNTMPPHNTMQYVNEHGQYMSPQQQQHLHQQPPPSHMQNPNHHYMQQPQSMYNDNSSPYNNHGYAPQYGNPQQPSMMHHQQQQGGYMNNRTSTGGGGPYDDYGHLQHVRDPNSPQPGNHFYLHDSPVQQQQQQPPPAQNHPLAPQRRTWGQPSVSHEPPPPQPSMVDVNAWQSQKKPSWMQQQQPQQPQQPQHHHQQQQPQQQQGFVLHQNGGGGEFQHLFQVHSSPQHLQRTNSNTGIIGVQRQHSMTSLRENHSSPNAMLKTIPTPMPKGPPPDEMMAPQSICFIGDEEDIDEVERDIIETMQNAHISDYPPHHHHHMNNFSNNNNNRGSSSDDYDSNDVSQKLTTITSGNLTYRIPSPNRPSLQSNSFQDPREERDRDRTNEKGFYISFDDEQPKRPKPPLRAKRSPKKERSLDSVDHQLKKRESLSQLHNNSLANENLNGTLETKQSLSHLNSENYKATYNKYTDGPPVNLKQLNSSNSHTSNNDYNNQMDQDHYLQSQHHQQHQQHQHQQQPPLSPNKPQSPTHATLLRQQQQSAEAKAKALVIGADVTDLDPESVDEMERKKEKILLLSMQRRQQQEEAKARKEIEAQRKRELERQKEEEKARKKEEQMARRAAILEQHRLKKAIEEAEREGKTLDRPELTMKQQASQSANVPRLRQQRTTRPRPKTIHVDDASVDISEASSLSSSRGKKGSSSNLTGVYGSSSSTMQRNTYRGSQDSLAIKGPKLYKQPAAKSNRGIILNAVEYCVFPGAVNRDAKQKVLEKIARSEAKHFLVLFRDAGCQFRALYSYVPETEQVTKLYGTGPSQVDEVMFDKFFKYNSGGKCFSQVHTKHLTVTIDAFTIHNSLWQGKKLHSLPSKKDMALVI